ncbi:MAG: VOC family protein [Candidatus Nitrosopolaris sp.]
MVAHILFVMSNLAEGGEKDECGWLKDKFGVSWQDTNG